MAFLVIEYKYRYWTYLDVLLQAASLLYFLSDWKLVGSLGICLKESPFHLGSFSQVCALTNSSDVFTNLSATFLSLNRWKRMGELKNDTFMTSEPPKFILVVYEYFLNEISAVNFVMFIFCWENKFLLGQSSKIFLFKTGFKSTKFWWFGCYEWVRKQTSYWSKQCLFFLSLPVAIEIIINVR